MREIEIELNMGSPFSCLSSIMTLYSFDSSMGVVMPMSAVCSTNNKGAIVSLNKAGSMRAASSRMMIDPPVPLVPCESQKRKKGQSLVAVFTVASCFV